MTEAAENKKGTCIFPTARQAKWVLAFLIGYFTFRLVYFAVSIAGYVPPDETTHLGLCRIFSGFFLPDDTPQTYDYGLVTHVPWLYYWVMGKLLLLNVFGIPDLIFLRLANIPIALAALYYSIRLVRLMTDDRLIHLLLVVVMTNTLMLTFLSASVSYDNLLILLATMAIYYHFAFYCRREGVLLGLSWLCQLAGCLTKSAFLPIPLILNILLLISEFSRLKIFPRALVDWWRNTGKTGTLLVAAIFFALVLNLNLYGVNLLTYGKPVPEMMDVLSPDQYMQNRIAARDSIFMGYKEGDIGYSQAMRMSSLIRHPGDRAGTVYLLRNYREHVESKAELMSPLEYLIPWGNRVLQTVYGIMGHISMFARPVTLWPISLLFLLAAGGALLRARSLEKGRLFLQLAAVAVGYLAILIYTFNYQNYYYYSSFDIALQGRYVFPVIAPFYCLFTYFLLRLFNHPRNRLILATLTALIFVASDLPFFLYHATRDWFF